MKLRFVDLDKMIVFGLNNQKNFVHVDDVPNGTMCDCVCPNCFNKLNAKNHGLLLAHHFAHINGSDCKKGHENTLPLIAKRILEKNKMMNCPKGVLNLPDSINGPQSIQIKDIELIKIDKYPPILSIETSKSIIIGFYIVFTDENLFERIRAYESKFENLLELDVRYFRNSCLEVEEKLKELLYKKNGYLRWQKRYDEKNLEEHIKKIASWKSFEIKANKYIYCPKTKQTSTRTKLGCDICSYLLSNIIRGESKERCIGFVQELNRSRILMAQKPDYSNVACPKHSETQVVTKDTYRWLDLPDFPYEYRGVEYCLIYNKELDKAYFVNIPSFYNGKYFGLEIDVKGNIIGHSILTSVSVGPDTWRKYNQGSFKFTEEKCKELNNFINENS